MIIARKILAILCLVSAASAVSTLSSQAANASSIWDGTLDTGLFGETRVSLEVEGDSADFSSPDANWDHVAATTETADRDTIFTAKSVGVTLRGRISDDGKLLSGEWTQRGQVRPIELHRRLKPALPSWSELSEQETTATPSNTEIEAILRRRVSQEHQSVGMVVGIIDRSGKRIIAYGLSDPSDPRHLDGNTVFEVGSISKVFTSLLLEIAVRNGRLNYFDPASKFGPSDLVIPQAGGRPITMIDLATHTSGLPADDEYFWGSDPDHPATDYDVPRLYRFVSQAKLSHVPGTSYDYSNVGGALLGQLLAAEARKPYGQLVREEITGPLGMNSTGLTPPPGAHVVIGHNAALKALSPFNAQAYDPAGGLRSTADDMLLFLAAELGYVKTNIAAAMQAQWNSVRRPAINRRVVVALGWHVTLRPEGEIVWHNGGTTGVRSFAGFNPKTGVGVVVLSNAYGPRLGPDDIGIHLLDPAVPLDVLAPTDH